jgi:hypothetical protein
MLVQKADGLTCTGERLSGSHGFIDTLQGDRQMTEPIFEAVIALAIIIAIAAVFPLFNKMRERKNGI